MRRAVSQHQAEVRRNLAAWSKKPLLREIYSGFYQRIRTFIDSHLPGSVLEIGSGIGNLKASLPTALASDLFPNPWLDLVCSAYDLPFRRGSISNLVLFDVFHHLEAPALFLRNAHEALVPGGRLIILDPYISATSYPVYGLLHHEPVGLHSPIDLRSTGVAPNHYYAAQANATRLFFSRRAPLPLVGWEIVHKEAFSCFHYLLSGGYSKPSFYPAALLNTFQALDRFLSRLPRLFAGRCFVVLRKQPAIVGNVS